MNKWDIRYQQMAKLVASWSKDPSTRTGAVIVTPQKTVVSVGFNGFPRGVADDSRLYDRPIKYQIIVHCEMNAVLTAPPSSTVKPSTIDSGIPSSTIPRTIASAEPAAC